MKRIGKEDYEDGVREHEDNSMCHFYKLFFSFVSVVLNVARIDQNVHVK